MIYAVYVALVLISFLVTLNGFMRGAKTPYLDAVLSIFLIGLFGASFFIAGWKFGLAAVGLSFLTTTVVRPAAAWVALRIIEMGGRRQPGMGAPIFPYETMLALLYPVGAIVYMATQTPATTPEIIGYGLANLGYLLFGVCVVVGKFRPFGLKSREWAFVYALIAFVSGTFLTNI